MVHLRLCWILAHAYCFTVILGNPLPSEAEIDERAVAKCPSQGLFAIIKFPSKSCAASTFCSSYLLQHTTKTTTKVVGQTKTCKTTLHPVTSTVIQTALTTESSTTYTATYTDVTDGPIVADATVTYTTTITASPDSTPPQDGDRKVKRHTAKTPSYFSGYGSKSISCACSCLITKAPTSTCLKTTTKTTTHTVTQTYQSTRRTTQTITKTIVQPVYEASTLTVGRTGTTDVFVTQTVHANSTTTSASSTSSPVDPTCQAGYQAVVNSDLQITAPDEPISYQYYPWSIETYGGCTCTYSTHAGIDGANALSIKCVSPDKNSYSVVVITQSIDDLCPDATYAYSMNFGIDQRNQTSPPDPLSGMLVGIGDPLVVPYQAICPGAACVPSGQRYGFQQITGTYTATATYSYMYISLYLGPAEANAIILDGIKLTVVPGN